MRIIHDKQTQKNKQEWLHQRMVQKPLSSNDTVHWTVQVFQDDDWRRKEKRNLRHDRRIKSSVWTRHPIYEYHHPRVQIPVVCGKKKPRRYLSSVDEAKWESSTAVHFLARWWARLHACLLLRELCDFAARFVWNFSLFAQNCASRSRTRKTETERETEERAVCDRKRRRNGFRNGNIGCSIFRNCTGDTGEDVSARDERDGRNRYGGRGSVHTAEAVATAAWVRGHTGRVH